MFITIIITGLGAWCFRELPRSWGLRDCVLGFSAGDLRVGELWTPPEVITFGINFSMPGTFKTTCLKEFQEELLTTKEQKC